MKAYAMRPLPAVVCAAMLAGCAGTPPPAAPQIERLTGAALEAKLPAPVAAVSVDDIVALARRGEGAAAIVAKIDASRSQYRLDAGNIARMMQQGVAPEVVDHILDRERRRIFDDAATELARHDQACLERVEQEVRQCRLQTLSQPWPHQPFATCWPPHPGFPYWRCF